jgi:hypothetical protein
VLLVSQASQILQTKDNDRNLSGCVSAVEGQGWPFHKKETRRSQYKEKEKRKRHNSKSIAQGIHRNVKKNINAVV